MVVWPAPAAVVIPAALIVATALSDDFQATKSVKTCVSLFINTPVALNCRSVPTILVEVSGVIEIEVNADEVRAADPDILPEVAVIVTEPAVTAVTSPLDPSAVPTVATPLVVELHTTDVVRS